MKNHSAEQQKLSRKVSQTLEKKFVDDDSVRKKIKILSDIIREMQAMGLTIDGDDMESDRLSVRVAESFNRWGGDPGVRNEISTDEWNNWLLNNDLPISFVKYPGVSRANSASWWSSQIRLYRTRSCGHIELLTSSLLGHEFQPCSALDLEKWAEKKRRNIKNCANKLIKRDDGEIISLATISISKTKNSRAELLSRVMGLDQLARDQGLVPFLVTITLPPHMHPSFTEWDGETTPAIAMTMMRRQWKRWRAYTRKQTAYRNPLKSYGILVAEPHHDGCPHLHLLIWTDAVEELQGSLEKYFAQPSQPQTQAGSHSDSVVIDEIKGDSSQAVYYVIKNLFRHDFLDEANRTENQVEIWRSVWGIRAFSIFSTHARCPPITPWREFRKLEAVSTCSIFSGMWRAAVESKWFEYASAHGRLMKITTIYSTVKNQYDEIVTGRPVGVLADSGSSVEYIATVRRWKTLLLDRILHYSAAVTLADKKSSKGKGGNQDSQDSQEGEGFEEVENTKTPCTSRKPIRKKILFYTFFALTILLLNSIIYTTENKPRLDDELSSLVTIPGGIGIRAKLPQVVPRDILTNK